MKLRLLGYRLMQEIGPHSLQDAPEHFGRFYPCTVDMLTGTVVQERSNQRNWYAHEMIRILKSPRVHFGFRFDPLEGPQSGDLIVNALDPVFGHALYKLSAANAIARQQLGRKTWCVVTENLQKYISTDAGCIIYNGKANDLRQMDDLAAELVYDVESRGAKWAFAQCSRLNGQSHFLDDQALQGLRGKKRHSILLVMRDDRPWGGIASVQNLRLRALCRRLKKSLGCELVGAGYGEANWLDCTDRKIHLSAAGDSDRQLLNEAAEAVLCFGIHGSHLLLPSAASWGIVELVPPDRYGNYGQGIWPDPERPVIDFLYGFRPIFGRDRWLIGTRVAEVAKVIEACYTGYEAWKMRQDDSTLYA